MLTNECHECENYIEFPEHGVGEEIRCPHCGLPVVLTASAKTLPPESPPADGPATARVPEAATTHAKGEDLLRAAGLEAAEAAEGRLSPSARKAKRKVSIKALAMIGAGVVLVLAALVIVAIAGVSRRGRPADSSPEHQEAISRLEQDARAARAPTGLFGAKWLMSMAEVMKAAPNAKRLSPGVLRENRTFYDRPSQVTYHFSNDSLLLVEVSFVGASTPADFDQTQTRLAAEYGPMPAPSRFEGYTLCSMKRISHFAVQHCLSAPGGTSREQVFVSVGKAGSPKNMLKNPLPVSK